MAELPHVDDLIPQRPPFQMIDEILVLEADRLVARKTLDADLPFYGGHFPGNPITPGIFLCEAVHQAGAALIAGGQGVPLDGIPLLTRIRGTKLKKMVPPGSVLEVEVVLTDRVGGIYELKGTVRVEGAVVLEHRVALGMANEEGLVHPEPQPLAAAG